KELARQAHEQGNRELFQTTLAELKRRAPSDDQVHALTQMPPPGGESLKPGAKRRAAPKRPTDPSVAAVLSSSIPPHPSQAPSVRASKSCSRRAPIGPPTCPTARPPCHQTRPTRARGSLGIGAGSPSACLPRAIAPPGIQRADFGATCLTSFVDALGGAVGP